MRFSHVESAIPLQGRRFAAAEGAREQSYGDTSASLLQRDCRSRLGGKLPQLACAFLFKMSRPENGREKGWHKLSAPFTTQERRRLYRQKRGV
jgi:hypothetical protein